MYDRLLFPSKIEQEGTKEIIHDNFPAVYLLDIVDDVDPFVTDLKLEVPKETFFEWAYLTPGAASPILFYCLYLSVELLEPPVWMANVLTKIKYMPKRLTDGS